MISSSQRASKRCHYLPPNQGQKENKMLGKNQAQEGKNMEKKGVTSAQTLREVRILAALYGFNGIFCLAFAGLFIWALANQRSILPQFPPGVQSITFSGDLLGFTMFLNLVLAAFGFLLCFVFLRMVNGVLRGREWAAVYGFTLSVVATGIMFVMLKPIYDTILYCMTDPSLYPSVTGGFAAFSPAFLVSNLLCLYYLTRPQVKKYLR